MSGLKLATTLLPKLSKPAAPACRYFTQLSRPTAPPTFKSLLHRVPHFSRSITQVVPHTTQQPLDWRKIATSAGGALVAVVGANYALNRDTRDALSPSEASYLHETFLWTGAGLGITASLAKYLHSSGSAARLMSLNPFVFMGVGLVASIGSMFAVFGTAPDSPAHYAAWAVVCHSVSLFSSLGCATDPSVVRVYSSRLFRVSHFRRCIS